MKKSQRLRLSQLRQKKLSDAASLTAAEAAELAQLETLAIAHPDASKDEDDTKPITAADFLSKLTAAFTAKAALAAENATLKARVAELEAQVTTAAAAKPAADSQLSTLNSQLASATAALASVAAAVGLKPEELAGRTAEQLKQAHQARIELRAGEKLAELGFPLSGLPPSAQSGSTDPAAAASGQELLAQFNAISDPKARAEFYEKNKAAMFGKN